MRRGRTPTIVKDESGNFIGVNLSADFVSEHEWGIEKLRALFKMDDQAVGIDKRKSNAVPTGLHRGSVVHHGRTIHCLVVNRTYSTTVPSYDYFKNYDQLAQLELFMDNPRTTIACAWDEGSFGIATTDATVIDQLHQAIVDNDIVLSFGQSNIIDNPGLNVLVASKIPSKAIEALKKIDLDAIALKQASDQTGIVAKIDAFSDGKEYFDRRCGYYALSPRWKHAKDKVKTKYNVVYWLNPMQQDINNYGWFTVEDLELWIKGEGPIPINKSKKNK